MTIKKTIDYKSYIACVEAIVNAFYDDAGRYAPHLGRIVLRSIFVDYFISDIEEINGKEGDELIEFVMGNEEIDSAFHEAIRDYSSTELSFATAYEDAMSIIDYRNGSLMQGISLFGSVIEALMSPDNISKVYEASERLKKIAAADKDNVTPLFPNQGA